MHYFPSSVEGQNPKWLSFGGGCIGVILGADTYAPAPRFCDRPSMSSKLPSILSATEEDIQLLLAAQCHIGTKNCDKQMESYVWKRRQDGALILVSLLLILSYNGFFFNSAQVSTSLTSERHGRSSSLPRGLLPPSRTPTTFV